MLGIAIALVLGEVLAWWNSVVGWCVFGVAIIFLPKRKHRRWLLLPLVVLIGFIRTDDAMQLEQLEQQLLGKSKSICVQGRVEWIEKTASMWKIELSELVQKEKKEQIGGNCIVYVKQLSDVKIGNRLQVEGKIERFPEAVNPGMYDQRAYYRAQNIYYCLWADQIHIVDFKNDWMNQLWNRLFNQIYQIRQKLSQVLEKVAKEEDFGVMKAVFLGEKSSLDAELKELYQANGIAHILAVSGLHVSCIGMLIDRLLRKLSGSFILSGMLSGLFLVFYIFMTGSSVSALRAGIMFLSLLLANAIGNVYDMASALSMAVILILFFYPLQLFQCGFQLSVSTVAGIAIVNPLILEGEKHSKWWKTIMLSCAIQCTSIPILLWHFFTYPIYSIVLNAIVIPMASVLFLSAGASAVIGLYSIQIAIFLAGSGHVILSYYQFVCQVFETIPGAVQVIGRAGWQQLFLYLFVFIGCLVHMEKRAYRRRRDPYGIVKPERTANAQKERISAVCFLIFLAVSLCFLRPIASSELRITVLDVGQGDCSFLSFPDGTTMLIDGGSTTEKEVGKYRMQPFLYSQGIQSIDYVVLTHPDADHINGVSELLASRAIQIKNLILPNIEEIKEVYMPIRALCERVIWMEQGMKWNIDAAAITCLHPDKDFYSEDINDYSIVLKLEYGKFSMLFMGDLGMDAEQNLLDLEKTTVLKAGHHGSKYSTSEQFLERTNPDHVILSYGEGNSYGHPHAEVIQRLRNSNLWHTAKQGAIQIRVTLEKYSMKGYLREEHSIRSKIEEKGLDE